MGVVLYDIFCEYELGSIIGQKDWYETAGGDDDPSIQDSVIFEGRKTVEGKYASATYCRADKLLTSGENIIQWARWVWRTSNKNEDCPYMYFFKDSTFFAVAGYHDGYYHGYNGNGAGGGSWVSTGYAGVSSEWIIHKVKLDIPNNKYDYYVDDMETPKLTGLGFRNSVNLLNKIRIFLARSTQPSSKYLADLIISDCDPCCDCHSLISNGFYSGNLISNGLA